MLSRPPSPIFTVSERIASGRLAVSLGGKQKKCWIALTTKPNTSRAPLIVRVRSTDRAALGDRLAAARLRTTSYTR